MMCRFKHVLALLLGVVALGMLSGAAHAIAPSWMPGFPLRAGATVIVMWAPVPGATEYKLLKKMGEGDFKEVFKGALNTFNDMDAPVTKTVEYKVIAVIGGKDTDASPVQKLQGVEPLKPPAFTGVIPSADAITIRWTNPQGSVFYNLYRSEQKEGTYDLLSSVQQETFTDRKLEKGKVYFYKVTAVDRNNTESEKSVPIEAKLAEAQAVVNVNFVWKKPLLKAEFAGEEIYEFNQPGSIGINKAGELVVADRTSIQFLDKDGKFLRRLNFDPKWSPVIRVDIHPDGSYLGVFLSEQLIRKMDETGKVSAEIKYPGEPGGQLTNSPNMVTVDKAGNFWIADPKRGQVIKLDPSGKELAVYGRISGSYSSKTITQDDFPGVSQVYFNPNDEKIYAVLPTNAAIRVLDPKTGKVVKTLGGLGTLPGQFQGISGIHFKKDGGFLVLDNQMLVLKEYGKDFEYIASYADVDKKGSWQLSANMATTFVYSEELKRFYIVSLLANKGYMYEMPK